MDVWMPYAWVPIFIISMKSMPLLLQFDSCCNGFAVLCINPPWAMLPVKDVAVLSGALLEMAGKFPLDSRVLVWNRNVEVIRACSMLLLWVGVSSPGW